MKNLITQVENSKEILTRRINQIEDRISGLKKYRFGTNKKGTWNVNLTKRRKEHIEIVEHY